LLKRKNLFIVFNLFLILLKIPIKDNQEDHLDGEGEDKEGHKKLGPALQNYRSVLVLELRLSFEFKMSLVHIIICL